MSAFAWFEDMNTGLPEQPPIARNGLQFVRRWIIHVDQRNPEPLDGRFRVCRCRNSGEVRKQERNHTSLDFVLCQFFSLILLVSARHRLHVIN